MPSLPRLDGRTVVKAFGRDGWELVRQKGSHMILVKEGSWATLSAQPHPCQRADRRGVPGAHEEVTTDLRTSGAEHTRKNRRAGTPAATLADAASVLRFWKEQSASPSLTADPPITEPSLAWWMMATLTGERRVAARTSYFCLAAFRPVTGINRKKQFSETK